MKINLLAFVTGLAILTTIACNQASQPTIKDIYPKQLNLLQHGIPVSIQTPENAKVTNRSDKFLQDVIVEGDRFYVQVYGQTATSSSCNTLATEARTELKTTEPTFQKFILEEDCGHIYEVQAPGDTTKCYNFFYYVVKGSKSFSFTTTTARRKPFTKQEVENMYTTVKEHL